MDNPIDTLRFYLKWLGSILFIALLVGSSSALFLYLLTQVTSYRERNLWVLYLLPLAGVLIVWVYARYGQAVQAGNKLILKEYKSPSEVLPLRMTPLIMGTTLCTHLFGGSAGREGTAIQYGASISDQFSRFFNFDPQARRILLNCGMAAGFSSLFGTPWAGLIFALELVGWNRYTWKAAIPTLLCSFLAGYVCNLYGNQHSHYPQLSLFPTLSLASIAWASLAALLFGLTARLFVQSHKLVGDFFKLLKQPLLRPVVAGLLIIAWVSFSHSTRHIGLGLPTILAAFDSSLPAYDFLIKILLTVITLSAGFKGGEVTPLFFIGATLGNALCLFIPLPMALLVAMGFVAVFSGCTKTPIACTIMGMELFGPTAACWLAIACFISYWASGQKGIYTED